VNIASGDLVLVNPSIQPAPPQNGKRAFSPSGCSSSQEFIFAAE
jgi:hypothetical protein